jgi:hypothetical protein
MTNLNSCGGNGESEDLDRQHVALLWMSYEAILADLALTVGSHAAWIPKPQQRLQLGTIRPSLKGWWHILEYLPIKHLVYGEHEEKHTCL